MLQSMGLQRVGHDGVNKQCVKQMASRKLLCNTSSAWSSAKTQRGEIRGGGREAQKGREGHMDTQIHKPTQHSIFF